MRLRLEKSACVGHALCHGVSEELFPLDEYGYCATQTRDVEQAEHELARHGVESCPERALVLEDDR